jgi:hypothetical protein
MSNSLAVDIDFDSASQQWKANKIRQTNGTYRYIDNRHKLYLTRPQCILSHKPRCGWLDPTTGKKCTHVSYFTKIDKARLGTMFDTMDVDSLDGVYCWVHKKSETS